MNDKQRKNIIELARTLPPTTIARMSGIPLEEITGILGADDSGSPRNGAMSTMKFDSGMSMIPEKYSPINRDTTSQGTEPWQVQSDHAMDRQQQDLPGFGSLSRGYETSEDRGNPFLQATGSPQFNPHAAGPSHSMVANPPMNPQQFMQEDMMQQQQQPMRPLMNPDVPRQEFDPYMNRRNRY